MQLGKKKKFGEGNLPYLIFLVKPNFFIKFFCENN